MALRAMKLGVDGSKDDVKNLPDDIASYSFDISTVDIIQPVLTVVIFD